MATVIIEQFNPATQCWNRISEVDYEEYDPKAPVKNKYNGPYRTRIVGIVEQPKQQIEEVIPEEELEIEGEVLEETEKKEHSFFSWKDE